MVLLGACLWTAALAVGASALLRYENAPGAAGAAPAVWPDSSRLPRDARLPTLVMLLHPRCPCSEASIEELSRIVARADGRLTAYVLATVPAGAPPGFGDSDLIRSARAIPGVIVRTDEGGVEARRFGAETSGQVSLYAPDGRLLFSGGITASRGHAGDNAGSDAVLSLLAEAGHEANTPAAVEHTAVYGCSLTDERRPGAPGVEVQEVRKTCPP